MKEATSAPSLSFISDNIGQALEPHFKIASKPVFELETKASFYQPIQDFSALKWTKTRVEIDQVSKLAGILFCSPDSEFAKKEILPHLDYFNVRTGNFVEFYCAGFGTTQGTGLSSSERYVPVVDGHQWWFNVSAFDSLRKEMEKRTKWTYSGETDLILFTANRNLANDGYLSFSPSILCRLEAMARDGAFTSVRAFMEQIAQLGETYEGRDPIKQLSIKLEVKIGRNVLKDLILSILPQSLKDGYKKAEHLTIQDVSK